MIERAQETIAKHPEYTVAEIARACAVSESALYAAFHAHSDKSIAQIRRGVIMATADAMLISTDHSIEEISRRMGFGSGTYFRKCFKEYFGVSPRERRKQAGI